MTITYTHSSNVPYNNEYKSLDSVPGVTTGYPSAATVYTFNVGGSKTSRHGGNWRVKVARGFPATTAFEASESGMTVRNAMLQFYGTTVANNWSSAYIRKGVTHWYGGLNPPAPDNVPSVAQYTVAENQARSAFYKSLHGQMSLLQLGHSGGELRETLQTIRNPAKAIRRRLDDYLADVKKSTKRTKSIKRRNEVIAATYLEYTFGMKPLYNDVADALDYLAKRKAQLSQEYLSIGGRGLAESATFVNNSKVGGASRVYASVRETRSAMVRYRGAIRSSATGTSVWDGRSLGLSIQNYVPDVWNLLPWTFVADYFTNIGDVLTAWSNQNVSLAWCNKTVRGSCTRTLCSSYAVVGLATVKHKMFAPCSGEAYRKSIWRTSVNDVPLPWISYEIPGMGVKWLNLAMLAKQAAAHPTRVRR